MTRTPRPGALTATAWLLLSQAGWTTPAQAPDAGTAQAAAPAPCATAETPASFAAAFRAPPRGARPRIRYWTPEAAVTDEAIRGDVDAISAQGFGEIELVAMTRPKAVSPDYAWGTDRWDRLVSVLGGGSRPQGARQAALARPLLGHACLAAIFTRSERQERALASRPLPDSCGHLAYALAYAIMRT
jgi:hypothetical protein